MLKHYFIRNISNSIPKDVMFIEYWRLDFGFFEVAIRTNWIYADGKTKKVSS